MTIPHTPTITLNLEDHPVVIYLERADQPGQYCFGFKIHTTLLADKNAMRDLLLRLNQECVAFYWRNYVQQAEVGDDK